jgi:cytochrome c biogenesis protein CcdA
MDTPTAQKSIQCPYCKGDADDTFIFCPHCGKELHLPVTLDAQLKLFAHSIILPMLGFITITSWKASVYASSVDPNRKTIGRTAYVLFTISTVFVLVSVYFTTKKLMVEINAVMNDQLFIE